MTQKGITLIETVLSAALLLLVSLYGLECFGLARRLFVGLKAAQEEDLAAAVAIESLRRDVAKAGAGLAFPIELGLCSGAELRPDGFLVRFAAEARRFKEDIVPGQTLIRLETAEDLKAGCDICLSEDNHTEIKTIQSSGEEWIVIGEGAENSYGMSEGRCFAVESVTTWFDRAGGILRRRINDGPGQPLLEEAGAFEVDWDPDALLFRFRLRMISKKEKLYEASIVPKNLALASHLAE